jgi:hypothetical protein
MLSLTCVLDTAPLPSHSPLTPSNTHTHTLSYTHTYSCSSLHSYPLQDNHCHVKQNAHRWQRYPALHQQ